MKIEKRVLADALKVLGKVVGQNSPEAVLRSVRVAGVGERVWLTVTDGVDVVALEVATDNAVWVDFAIPFKELRELTQRTRAGVIEFVGEKLDWPQVAVPPAEAVSLALPENFCSLLAQAAPVVNRHEARLPLQGINLSSSGLTVTDGKQLLHIPLPLKLEEDFTLPFPLALLTAKPEGCGTLQLWHSKSGRIFKIEIGGFVWYGKAVSGSFPNWRQVVPTTQSLDYSITIREPERVVEFLKSVPGHPPFHGIELNATPEGVSVIPVDFPHMVCQVEADHIGVQPRAVLALNKHILQRMLQQGYRTFRANSDGMIPIMAEGGGGQYIAMPLRSFRKIEIPKTTMEETKMEIESKPVVEPIMVPVASPLDELNANVEEFRVKLKTLFDESNILIRKVKEAALQQKQKEREFVQARRAIERIKMAI